MEHKRLKRPSNLLGIMNAGKIIKLVSIGLLAIGLVSTYFAANFYYVYCYTISLGIRGYDCRNILTFPQLVISVGIAALSALLIVVTRFRKGVNSAS